MGEVLIPNATPADRLAWSRGNLLALQLQSTTASSVPICILEPSSPQAGCTVKHAADMLCYGPARISNLAKKHLQPHFMMRCKC